MHRETVARPSRAAVAAACLCWFVTSAPGQGNLTWPTVVPTANAASEGNSSTSIPFGSASARRVLFAYDGTVVGYERPVRFAGIELRADALAAAPVVGSYDFTLDCSTGRFPVGGMDLDFADNHGADRLRVFAGGLPIAPPAVGQAPNAFSLRIPFARPFEWDPRNGPLLLDFAYNAATPAVGGWDAVATPAVRMLWSGFAAATTASVQVQVAPVVRLLEAASVVPPAALNAYSGVVTPYPWATQGTTRVQHRYSPSQIPFTGPQVIRGIGWRLVSNSNHPGSSMRVKVTLSTGANWSLADREGNHGSDRQIVFDGTLVVPPHAGGLPVLRDFALSCTFQQPFEYDKARGPLLIDILATESSAQQGGLPVSLELSFVPGGSGLDWFAFDTYVSGSFGSFAFANQAPVVALVHTPLGPTVPQSLAQTVNAAAPNGTSIPFRTFEGRALNMLSAAAAGITQPTFVRHLRFRPAANTLSMAPSLYTGTIDLSNPGNTPATISNTFDANHGPNRRRVFTGQFSVPWFERPANDPRFLAHVKLQQPFLWDPAVHPYLSVDLRITELTAGPGFDAEYTANMVPGPEDAWVFDGASADAVVGSTQQAALAIQLAGEGSNGLSRHYGFGCWGSNGLPYTAADGVPTLPNPDFALRVRQAPGNALAVAVIGLQPLTTPLAGAPGCSLHTSLEIGVFGFAVTDTGGDGVLALPLIAGPSIHGVQFRSQWVVLDPGANLAGLTVSNAMQHSLAFF